MCNKSKIQVQFLDAQFDKPLDDWKLINVEKLNLAFLNSKVVPWWYDYHEREVKLKLKEREVQNLSEQLEHKSTAKSRVKI